MVCEIQIIWSDFAKEEIDKIHEFYRNRTKSLNIENRIIKNILIAPDLLKHSPEIGQREPALVKRKLEYRYIIESNYKLIFTINKNKKQVRITDVFDTRQNPDKIERNR